MARESSLSKSAKTALKRAGFNACRVENPCEPGFPDLAYQLDGTIGLCELKSVAQPKRDSTPVRLGLRPAQIAFARTWHPAPVFLLAQIGEYYLLFKDFQLYLPLNQLQEAALWGTKGKAQFREQFPYALQKMSISP